MPSSVTLFRHQPALDSRACLIGVGFNLDQGHRKKLILDIYDRSVAPGVFVHGEPAQMCEAILRAPEEGSTELPRCPARQKRNRA